ncbi:1-deoxy-D-xylulose-5-phosphate synthase [Pokkaliibacter sp. MBI-7]|uniref:1-deoxy-D-xylulose-5-phosphate synthase n=1 Tax=Pokkaliibacter sp. MBI-7 TaxID=3040600 RepID=UPI00244A3906|nr:1-deoxy-D-xylulose-5-phosphate synthase [Pokkaliibacter sp. MBI-7]MDH2433860.1 1-deoxy-D-xylulose-5-phosphate synthase [Pokkaliibacter sp. MBI-7]
MTELPRQRPSTPLLDQIDQPAAVRQLPGNALPLLADQLRRYLLWSVSQSGGHFGAGLGVIELTVALHHVLDLPHDQLIWDVGHQAYPHKVLSGRRDALVQIRQAEGPAPFPSRDESPYDAFGVGHSSTSISAGLGMAIAFGRQIVRPEGVTPRVVCVIGDGAFTAGMAFEAINHAAQTGVDLTVILNDNDMSISPNVGSLATYLDSSHAGELFTALGFSYHGPLDGHDLSQLPQQLDSIIHQPGLHLIHVLTRKGKGFTPAEADPVGFHAIAKLEPASTTNAKGPKYSRIFSDWICAMAVQDQRLLAITPAMREGSDLIAFSQQFPERYFDVGIAEQHAVTLAAGMACASAKPVVAIYSTFLQRAYDQLIHDVAIQNLDVLFAIDRAGLVGEDGPTHAGVYDISFLRCIPNMLLLCPSDEAETRAALTTAYHYPGPAAVRYPRGHGPGNLPDHSLPQLPLGQARPLHHGQRIAVLAFGPILHDIKEAALELNCSLADMRFVKPLDAELLERWMQTHEQIVTIEEHAIAGGAGSAVAEHLLNKGYTGRITHLGIEDRYIPHGSADQQRQWCGLDRLSLKHRLEALLAISE